VLWRIKHGEVAGISPKVAVLMIGTNNAGMGDKPARIAAGIKAILGELRTRLPKTKILLLAIFPRGDNDRDELYRVNHAVNRIIAGYADNRHVFFLNINKRFLTRRRVVRKDLLPDLLHPNAKGYRVWARAMEPTLKRLMGER
jgi:beta-glucosidase